MRKYETIVILDPDISDEKQESFFEKVNEMIPQDGGVLIETDKWGTRKLAYEIKKKVRGNYTRLVYCGTGNLVNEMERTFQIDDRILKYMTVLLEKEVDIEKIKAEISATEVESQEESSALDAEPVTETTENQVEIQASENETEISESSVPEDSDSEDSDSKDSDSKDSDDESEPDPLTEKTSETSQTESNQEEK
jgi:small subunit ribosomal protein S6